MSELATLKAAWAKADNGNQMPADIADQPIELVRKAVKWMEQGIRPGITKPVVLSPVGDGSLMDWDRQDDKAGSAYG